MSPFYSLQRGGLFQGSKIYHLCSLSCARKFVRIFYLYCVTLHHLMISFQHSVLNKVMKFITALQSFL